jgi:peroxiredoxin
MCKVFFLPAFIFYSFLYGQETGKSVLQKSAAACKELKSVNYEVYVEDFAGKVTADIVINRVKDFPLYGISQVKVSGLALKDDGSEQVSYAYNGEKFEFMDVKRNSIVRIDSPTVNKVARTAMINYMMLPIVPYFEKQPFGNIFLNGKKFELQDDTSIYNVPCYRIVVTMEVESNVTGKVTLVNTWFIGKKDWLIRGIESKSSRQFVKIKNIDRNYADDFFRLAATQQVITVSGNEPIIADLLKKGEMAPEWILPVGDGGKISLKELRGKVVLLDFWGTWCVPCIKAMPDIQAIYDHFKNKDVMVIGVSVEMEKTAKPMDFIHKKNYTYSIVLDGKQIVDLYKVKVFPTLYLIDRQGRIIHAEQSTSRENFKEDIIAKIEASLK